MYKVYVAGAITNKDHTKLFQNIGNGIKASAQLLKNGFAPFCPFLDHQFLFHENITIEQFYEYSLKFLECCDAMLVVGSPEDYNNSVGTQKEIKYASDLDIPIIYKEQCIDYLKALEAALMVSTKQTMMSMYGNSLKPANSWNTYVAPPSKPVDGGEEHCPILADFLRAISEDDSETAHNMIGEYDRTILMEQIEIFYINALYTEKLECFYLLLKTFKPSYNLSKKLVKKIENFEIAVGNIYKYYELKVILTNLKVFIPDFPPISTMHEQITMVKIEFEKYVKLVEYENVDLLHYYGLEQDIIPININRIDHKGKSQFWHGLKPQYIYQKTVVKSDNKELKSVFRYIDHHDEKDFLHLEEFDAIIKDCDLEPISDYLSMNNYRIDHYINYRQFNK